MEITNGFHAHSEYSLDGACTVKQMIKRCEELGRSHCVITDHGVMSALGELYFETKGSKIKPIFGIEAYCINKNWSEKSHHVTIHFKTYKAYQYFCNKFPEMVSTAEVKYGNLKPILQYEDLFEIKNDIVLGSGCFTSWIQSALRENNISKAEKIYDELESLVGKDNFFIEVMPHVLDKNWVKPEVDKETKLILKEGYFEDLGRDLQKDVNILLVKLARKKGGKIICSEDSHMTHEHKKFIQDVRIANGEKTTWKFSVAYSMEPIDKWMPVYEELGISKEELVENSIKHASLFDDFKWEKKLYLVDETLINYTHDSLTKELVSRFDLSLIPVEKKDIYMARFKEEIDVITNNGLANFIPYILLIHEVVQYSRQHNCYISPRGSAGGSLILFLLGISIADPIKYKLSFARFLTKGRIMSGNLPDIDIDCGSRDLVFNYLFTKYKDKICLVSTNQVQKMKNAIKDCERILRGKVSDETVEMTKGLPDFRCSVDEFFNGYEDEDGTHPPYEDTKDGLNFKNWKEVYPDVWEHAHQCLGIQRSRGVHACATLITPERISNIIPISKTKDDYPLSEYVAKIAEKLGIIKYDFLSLDCLSSIGKTIDMINRNYGKDLKWGEFPLDDKVMEFVYRKNNMAGIFQCTRITIPFIKKGNVKTIIDLSNFIALVRPGALDAPAPDGSDQTGAQFYLSVAQGEKQPFSLHKKLDPILEETFGIILYQEQIQEIFKQLGGMDDSEASEAMRAVSKKNKELLEKYCNILIENIKGDFTEEQIKMLIKSIMASGRYAFNKSHSVCYAVNSYAEAWLKFYYPLEFWVCKLNEKIDKLDDIYDSFYPEVKHYIKPIHVGNSDGNEFIIKDGSIYPPLNVVKRISNGNKIKELYDQDWGKFLDNLKNQKPKQKISATELFTALYCGLLGDFSIEDTTKKLEEIKKAMGSKASGGKSKADKIAIGDIKSSLDLVLFKTQNNPVYRFCYADENDLSKKGWDRKSHEWVAYMEGNNMLFRSLRGITQQHVHQFKGFGVFVLGVIKKIEKKPTKNGSWYKVVEFSLGVETFRFKVWKNNIYSDFIDDLNELLLVEVVPEIYNEFVTYTLKKVKVFFENDVNSIGV